MKLQSFIGTITPARLLLLSDEELRSCYFSRQKIVYARDLANAIVSKKLVLNKLSSLSDDVIRKELKKIKGIGHWTTDVFMMMSLHRCNCFPSGDVALMKSAKQIKGLAPETTAEEILLIAEKWQPYRTIASYLLWHAYLERRRIRKNHKLSNS